MAMPLPMAAWHTEHYHTLTSHLIKSNNLAKATLCKLIPTETFNTAKISLNIDKQPPN